MLTPPKLVMRHALSLSMGIVLCVLVVRAALLLIKLPSSLLPERNQAQTHHQNEHGQNNLNHRQQVHRCVQEAPDTAGNPSLPEQNTIKRKGLPYIANYTHASSFVKRSCSCEKQQE